MIWETTLVGHTSTGQVTAFQWRDGKEVDWLTFKDPGLFENIALSPDGKTLITFGGKILLWNVNLSGLAVEPAGKQITAWGDIKHTALFQNFPNPFNPETWIPYQLAEPSNVRLTIYTVQGDPIRTLVLGEQPAGIYQPKTKAIYWDGRTDAGEPASSGVYFYTLHARETTASGRMVLLK